jgi:hypothetical protein
MAAIGMSSHPPDLLRTLADLYEASEVGRTGRSRNGYFIDYVKLLRLANCDRGPAYLGVPDVLARANGTLLRIEKYKRRDDIRLIRVPPEFEAALFAHVARPSPTAERNSWRALFDEAAEWAVPLPHAVTWKRFCRERAELMSRGEGWQPFRRKHRARARFQLQFVAQLLAWNRPALIRTASAQITGRSKLFERSRGTFEALLTAATAGAVRTFADLQITGNPRSVTFHGPLRFTLDGAEFNYRHHTAPSAIGDHDLVRATAIASDAPRCVTVENATTFQELSRLDPGTLFIHTSYPNRATLELLRRLPAALPRFHFGDTDPWGFDVLRDLRQQLHPLLIAPLHMRYRESNAPIPLTGRELRKLDDLLGDPLLEDLRPELEKMRRAGSKGVFEQEHFSLTANFPFVAE